MSCPLPSISQYFHVPFRSIADPTLLSAHLTRVTEVVSPLLSQYLNVLFHHLTRYLDMYPTTSGRAQNVLMLFLLLSEQLLLIHPFPAAPVQRAVSMSF